MFTVCSEPLILGQLGRWITLAFGLFPVLLCKLWKTPNTLSLLERVHSIWGVSDVLLPPAPHCSSGRPSKDPGAQHPTLWSCPRGCRNRPLPGSLTPLTYGNVTTAETGELTLPFLLAFFLQSTHSGAFPSIYLIERTASVKLNCFHLCFYRSEGHQSTIKASFHLTFFHFDPSC